MDVSELNKKYGQTGKQCGSKLLYITSDGISETVHGYIISSWDTNYEPARVWIDLHKETPLTPDMKIWDDACDALYGKPKAPEFGRNLINI